MDLKIFIRRSFLKASLSRRACCLLLLISLLNACASLVEKGDELFEQGLYKEAANFYQRAINKDPDDVEARVGLNKARNKIIDRGLIEVRRLRLAANMRGAATRLEEILKNQLLWHLNMEGAVAFTQKEETQYAAAWITKELELYAQSKRPDEYRWLKYAFSHLINNARLGAEVARHDKQVEPKGKKICGKLIPQVSGQQYFYRRFVENYCRSWSVVTQNRTDAIDKTRYTHLRVNNKIRFNGNRDLASMGKNILGILNEGFKSSIWYANNGLGSFQVTAEGNMNYRHRAHRERRVVKYTVEEAVKRPTNNQQTERQTVKRTRSYGYNVKVEQESLRMNVTLSGKARDVTVSRQHSDERSSKTESHNEHFPKAELYPERPVYLNKQKWMNNHFKPLVERFKEAINAQWQNRYCNGSQTLHRSMAETLLRCAAVSPEDSRANAWMKQDFGIEYREMQLIIGEKNSSNRD